MCFRQNSLDTLRTWIKIIALFEILISGAKLCCQIGGVIYYAYNCKSDAAITGTSCQTAEELLTEQFVPALSSTKRMGAIIAILALDIGDVLTATIKYFAVKNDNSSGSKLSFRLGIFLWLVGITFYLYLFHISTILIFTIILVYSVRYLILFYLRKYLVALAFHKTHQEVGNGRIPDEEVTKF